MTALPKTIFVTLILSFCALFVSAQSTEFTYQGKLTSGGTPASGSHDLEFALYDALLGGGQLGSTITLTNVPVTDGTFSAKLNFGAQFPGANRFLEIRVRQSGGGEFTPLLPRQKIDSSPYSIKSLSAENAVNATNAATATNALQLGGIAANQFVLVGDARLSDARTPIAGSTNYVQNTTSPQSSSNFNISGTGTANIINATTQFNIGGNRILSNGGSNNLFAGTGAGQANTSGTRNTFFGASSGNANVVGQFNAFFGAFAGSSNTIGEANSFFGSNAGASNTGGGLNSFFGQATGFSNTSGSGNSFFGSNAGQSTTSGFDNTFVGHNAGQVNTVGNQNTTIGAGSNVGINNLTSATAIGHRALVNQSNAIVLGAINGVNAATADTNVGIGTTTPSNRLHILANGGNLILGNPGCEPGFAAIGFSATLAGCSNYAILGNATQTVISRPTGGVIEFREGNTTQASIGPGGTFTANGAGITNLNASSLGSGTVADARLSANVALLTGAQTFSGVKTFSAGTFFNGNVGIGTATPSNRLHIAANGGNVILGDPGCNSGFAAIGFSDTLAGCSNYAILGNATQTVISRPTGGVIEFREGNTIQASIGPGGTFTANGAGLTNLNASNIASGTLNSARLGVIPVANGGTGSATKNFVDLTTTQTIGGDKTFSGNVALGNDSANTNVTVNNRLFFHDAPRLDNGDALCSSFVAGPPVVYEVVRCSGFSSIRFKTGVSDFTQGLNLLNRLRPVNFRWKESGRADFGLIAEEVAEVEPLLAIYDPTGQIQGVKYDRIGVVLVNAVKEQQAQIEAQDKKITEQGKDLEELRREIKELKESIRSVKRKLPVLAGGKNQPARTESP